ncbi:hypothetical protein B0H13DRAFT_2338438 [Mycena leptocephala]|nr:hypothetical protein B0H13DRAFT_2338438 [Mycena leptocephala]
MAFYEEYIPLVQLYPRTFARIETPISILAPMSEVVITNNFVPPDRLADEWEEALDEYADFMAAAPGLKSRRKLNALKKVLNAWMPLLHPSDLRFAAGAENFATMLFALENKIKQYAQTLGTDPDTKDENLPANVEAFQSAVASFRELRRVGKVIISVPLPEPSKKPASSKKEGKSTKRSRSISVGPSDVETVEPDELDQEDVSMVDATQSSKIATLPDPPTDSDSEVEEVQKPVRKKVVTRSQKIVSDPKAEASTSKKSATSVPKEGDDSLTYREVLKILDEANKLVGHAAKIPHTVDGLQRMDCAIRTHLSQIAIRISIEIAKYDAVFDEYNRIRQIMEARNVGPKDHTILDVGNQSIFPPSVRSTFPPVPVTLSAAALVVAVVAVVLASRIRASTPFDTVSDKLIHSFAYLRFETLVDTIPVLAE